MRLFSRRGFLAQTSIGAAGWLTSQALRADTTRSANERLTFGVIGTGWRADIRRQGRGVALVKQAMPLADVVAICDVDSRAREFANAHAAGGKARLCEDYREVLDRPEIDAVLIATPDHWHAKIAIEALRAGKHLYCEKPMTLTIDEGKQICQAVRASDRVFLVGTQQRTEYNQRFAQAVALVRAGRIGQVRRISIGVDPGLAGGPFSTAPVPAELNWDLWQGPTPDVPYRPERCHWTFRWWYEYSGGKVTDWGAHHVDIAQWALDMEHSGPTKIVGTAEHPVPLKNGRPTRDDAYNTATTFSIDIEFPQGTTLNVHSGENGILFEGETGRFFVNRGRLSGAPVEALSQHPLPAHALEDLLEGPVPQSHMAHFVDCITTGRTPISDAQTHHRTLSTCHLANLAIRLGRTLHWDPDREQFVNAPEANTFLSRPARDGYEVAPA